MEIQHHVIEMRNLGVKQRSLVPGDDYNFGLRDEIKWFWVKISGNTTSVNSPLIRFFS